MNRCIAYNKNNNKCRAKLEEGKLFCCNAHYPTNAELVNEGCFMCFEKINNPTEIVYLKCHHAFHKDCYNEWLAHSTYETSVCIICLKEVFTKPLNIIKKKNLKKYVNIEKINHLNQINNILILSNYLI
jgi:hypothetical protein